MTEDRYFQKDRTRSHSMKAVPPPPYFNVRPNFGSKIVFGAKTTEVKNNSKSVSLTESFCAKRKARFEDDYFEDDEEHAASAESSKHETDEVEDDPLDQFMAGIAQQIQTESRKQIVPQSDVKAKGFRSDIDELDAEESYYKYMEENPQAGLPDESCEDEYEYDEDGNIISHVKKDMPLLPAINHADIEYEPFNKDFYMIHEEIANLGESEVKSLRKTLNVHVSGANPPKPVSSFAHFGFDEKLIKAIRRSEYSQPTAIQAQAIPAALSGRDIIGIAKTGSGKTAAFIWPMLMHIMDQREIKKDEGPIGLILAPTRELSLQIYNEAKKFGKIYNINIVCCYGGGSKWEQSKALEQTCEIIVATPGRMIDLIKMKATNLRRVTFLVLDEADRMFNMGFEPQVRSICDHVRPDRQTLLFSATFKKRIENLARHVLTDPVRIVQGDLNKANEDVTQHVYVFKSVAEKWDWLLGHIVKLLSEGSVLIFVTKKADAETVANNLLIKEFNCLLLHGDMEQAERNKVLMQFKKKDVDLMVATDVAARGLDIPHIRNVINYDIARDIDTHTHRIGRTGRAGHKGTAFTLITEKEKEFAGHLVINLEGANQEVKPELMELALRSSWFRNSRSKQNKHARHTHTVGGSGLGYKSTDSSNSKPYTRNQESETTQTQHSSIGRDGGRYAAMREAFKSQYMSQFRASSDETERTVIKNGVFAVPTPDMSTAFNSPTDSSQGNTTKSGKVKRSRWN